MKFIYLLLFSMGILVAGCKENPLLFAGGYSENTAENLSVFEFNFKNGNIETITGINAGPNPSYFCISDKYDLIYALNEVMEFGGNPGGGVTTLRYNRGKGRLEKLDEMLVPYGGPCYISGSADGAFLLMANYSSGSVAVVQLDESGMPERVTDSILFEVEAPDVSHPHMIMQDPAGKHVYLTDLGLDRIIVYNLDKNNGTLTRLTNGVTTLPKSSGPRHFVFNSSGTKMYLINELGSTIMVFDVDENGGLQLSQTLPSAADGFTGRNYCADIHISMDGKYLYGSNRGENTIVVFKILEDGTLSLAGRVSCGSDWPRNFVIDPSGKFLLAGNQRSDDISVFIIDSKTGIPNGPVNTESFTSPACLKFRN